jgi:polar amino acid transport system substrate-binding protein
MIRSVFAGLLLVSAASSAYAADVPLMTYHEFPPFVTEQGKGLTYALADYMTKKSGGKYTFVVEAMPRKRLDTALTEGKAVVVPWATPAFFGDQDQTKYKWSATVIQDANAVVSPKSAPVEYAGPDSLAGKTLGGVAGHRYGPVDALVDGGKIKRDDANSELTNLKKAAQARIDVTILADTAARYLIKSENLADKLHVSATPHSKYERRVFVSGGDADLAGFVTKTVDGMAGDADWKAISEPYLK